MIRLNRGRGDVTDKIYVLGRYMNVQSLHMYSIYQIPAIFLSLQ